MKAMVQDQYGSFDVLKLREIDVLAVGDRDIQRACKQWLFQPLLPDWAQEEIQRATAVPRGAGSQEQRAEACIDRQEGAGGLAQR
jgi:hypothetical protein